VAFWCCAQLEPRRERLALHCLQHVAGFEVYSPRVQVRSKGHRESLRPLFPGYCFIQILLQWHAARWSPGVTRIVLDGAVPAKVPDAIIAELRDRERNGIVVLPERNLRHGAAVRVLRGPFRELEGLFAGQAPHERVAILLSLLGGHQRVTLPRADVEAIG
jgi:transcription antitermination factor NusG